MITRKGAYWLAALAVSISLFGISIAGRGTSTAGKLTFKPTKENPGASGTATIQEQGDRAEVRIEVAGLKPHAVYTVWLVNMKPKMDMAGVGSGDYEFRTDGSGGGKYVGTVSATDLKKWQMLEVAYHPDGDPKNMKQIRTALIADLK